MSGLEEPLVNDAETGGAKHEDESRHDEGSRSNLRSYQKLELHPMPPNNSRLRLMVSTLWFKAKQQHDKYWLNSALKQSKTKSSQKNAVALDGHQKTFFKKLKAVEGSKLVGKEPPRTPGGSYGAEFCLNLLLRRPCLREDPQSVLKYVACCCSKPGSSEKTVVQKQMLRYCVHMQSNLVNDLICLGFCLETIAIQCDITLTDIIHEAVPNNDSSLVRDAYGLTVDAAFQYETFTENLLWSEKEAEKQRDANGKIFAHRYRDLFSLVLRFQNIDFNGKGRISDFLMVHRPDYAKARRL